MLQLIEKNFLVGNPIEKFQILIPGHDNGIFRERQGCCLWNLNLFFSDQSVEGTFFAEKGIGAPRGETTMKRGYASKNPTLLEIADVLGVQPDTVLKWIIEGKLMVALQGAQTIMMVDKNQALKNRDSSEILILTKLLSNQKWKAFSC